MTRRRYSSPHERVTVGVLRVIAITKRRKARALRDSKGRPARRRGRFL